MKSTEEYLEDQRKWVKKIGEGTSMVATTLGHAAEEILPKGKPVTPETLHQWIEEKRTELRGPEGTVDLSLQPLTAFLDQLERWLTELPPPQE